VSERRANRPDQLVFDTSVLSAFAEAQQFDLLGHYLAGRECFVTDVVRAEILVGAETHAGLDSIDRAEWLKRGEQRTDADLLALARWSTLIGSGTRNQGEASMFAFAEIHGAVSIIDDREATMVGRGESLEVHGSLWLIGDFYSAGKLTEYAATRLVDDLRAVGARLPCTGNEFLAWARAKGSAQTPRPGDRNPLPRIHRSSRR